MKKTVSVLAVLILLIIPLQMKAYANYEEEIDLSELADSIGDETKEILYEAGVEQISCGALSSISPGNLFNAFFSLFTGAAAEPLKFIVYSTAIAMLASLLGMICTNGEPILLVGNTALALLCAGAVADCVNEAFSVIEAEFGFTSVFFGVFASLAASSGSVSLAASGMIPQMFLELFSSGFIGAVSLPLVNVMCFCGFVCAFDNRPFIRELSGTVRKIYVFILGVISALFSGGLAIKTFLASSADSAASRGLRFLIGKSVPIIGSVISDSVSVINGSLMLIKNSVGVFGILTVLFTVAPILLKLCLWAAAFSVCRAVTGAFSPDGDIAFPSVFKDAFVLMFSTVLFCAAVFMISVGIFLSRGGAGI